MAGKSSIGFTKAAQKTKFVRNRDVKLKEKEVSKEAKIKKSMCEGVCDHCRAKVLWKFKYNKYKPLKMPGNCQWCNKKKVTKAYRCVCDECATSREVCGSCCRNITEANQERVVKDMSQESKEGTDGLGLLTAEEGSNLVPPPQSFSDGGVSVSRLVDDVSLMSQPGAETSMIVVDEPPAANEIDINARYGLGDVKWNETKFASYAASKYSKDRVVGETSLT